MEVGDDHHMVKVKVQLSPEQKEELVQNLSEKITAVVECQNLLIQETKKIILQVTEMSKTALAHLKSLKLQLKKHLNDTENDLPSGNIINLQTVFKPFVPSLTLGRLQSYFQRDFISEESKLNYSTPEEAIKRLAAEHQIFIQGHTASITSIAATKDSEYIVTGSRDGTVRLWNLAQQSQIATMEGHTHGVNCVAVTNDSKYAISGSSDYTVRIWDLKKRIQEVVLNGHRSEVSYITVSIDDKYLVSISDSGNILWNLKNKKKKAYLCATLSQIT